MQNIINIENDGIDNNVGYIIMDNSGSNYRCFLKYYH